MQADDECCSVQSPTACVLAPTVVSPGSTAEVDVAPDCALVHETPPFSRLQQGRIHRSNIGGCNDGEDSATGLVGLCRFQTDAQGASAETPPAIRSAVTQAQELEQVGGAGLPPRHINLIAEAAFREADVAVMAALAAVSTLAVEGSTAEAAMWSAANARAEALQQHEHSLAEKAASLHCMAQAAPFGSPVASAAAAGAVAMQAMVAGTQADLLHAAAAQASCEERLWAEAVVGATGPPSAGRWRAAASVFDTRAQALHQDNESLRAEVTSLVQAVARAREREAAALAGRDAAEARERGLVQRFLGGELEGAAASAAPSTGPSSPSLESVSLSDDEEGREAHPREHESQAPTAPAQPAQRTGFWGGLAGRLGLPAARQRRATARQAALESEQVRLLHIHLADSVAGWNSAQEELAAQEAALTEARRQAGEAAEEVTRLRHRLGKSGEQLRASSAELALALAAREEGRERIAALLEQGQRLACRLATEAKARQGLHAQLLGLEGILQRQLEAVQPWSTGAPPMDAEESPEAMARTALAGIQAMRQRVEEAAQADAAAQKAWRSGRIAALEADVQAAKAAAQAAAAGTRAAEDALAFERARADEAEARLAEMEAALADATTVASTPSPVQAPASPGTVMTTTVCATPSSVHTPMMAPAAPTPAASSVASPSGMDVGPERYTIIPAAAFPSPGNARVQEVPPGHPLLILRRLQEAKGQRQAMCTPVQRTRRGATGGSAFAAAGVATPATDLVALAGQTGSLPRRATHRRNRTSGSAAVMDSVVHAAGLPPSHPTVASLLSPTGPCSPMGAARRAAWARGGGIAHGGVAGPRRQLALE